MNRRLIPPLICAALLMTGCEPGDEPDWLDEYPGASTAPARQAAAPPSAASPQHRQSLPKPSEDTGEPFPTNPSQDEILGGAR